MKPGQRLLRRLLPLAGALAVSACTVLGPDYREPELPWLAAWQSDLYGQVAAPDDPAHADLRFWWRVFDDPALDALIEAARHENPTLRIAGLRILESRAVLGGADAARYPQLQQATGAVDYVNTGTSGGSLPDGDQELVSYQAGFNLAWELDFWGRFRRAIESADAAFLGSIANQRNGQVLLAAQVADLYYAYRTTQLRIAIARSNAEIQQRSYEITQRIYESGQDSELDKQQARTQYLATLAKIPALQITGTGLRNALCALLGRPPGELPEIAGRPAPGALPRVERVLLREIPASLLLRRPDVRAAARQVAAQSAQIGVAEADFYPSIALFGTLGWSASSLAGTPDTTTLGIGPHLSWNIFDHGLIASNVRVQDARLQQLIESYRNTALQAAREIDDAAVSIVKTAEQAGILDESVQASERALEIANKRYQEGYADFQRVLDAQRALFAQSESRLVNQGNHVSAVIALYKALGGGWLPATIDDVVQQDTRDSMRQRADWGGLLDAPLPEEGAAGEPKQTGSTR
ncbi:MAG: efflux transporter outer membrane subunit [Gammaproteobacteria bacterium]|nr:efflux transporter outer membrane subunit [Gammaproteobacteria bacterium]